VSVVASLLHSLRFLVRSRAALYLEIVVNAAGLHRMLTEYIAYYMRSRTHLALGKDTPSPRPVSPLSAGRIVATPEVGGLHHRYGRPLHSCRTTSIPATARSQSPVRRTLLFAVRCADVRIPEGIVCGAQRGITRGFRGGRQAFCIVFVSTFR
jgi:hypothetical protein